MVIKALLLKKSIHTEHSQQAKDFYKKSRFGTLRSDGCVALSWLESCYLVERKKLEVYDYRHRKLSFSELVRKAARIEHDFWIRYIVFRDFRDRGYIIKTALKFGADFRVYDKGKKPGQAHARWIVYPVREAAKLTWQDFSAKNRVAHSVKKNLLLAVVDDENDVSYWEVSWLKP